MASYWPTSWPTYFTLSKGPPYVTVDLISQNQMITRKVVLLFPKAWRGADGFQLTCILSGAPPELLWVRV